LALLDQGMGRQLVLVCTPAGFGKTTLLAEWGLAEAADRWPGWRWMRATTTRRGSGAMSPRPREAFALLAWALVLDGRSS
jgi:CRISPR/Cas system-associated endonuclease/helicase Cas3